MDMFDYIFQISGLISLDNMCLTSERKRVVDVELNNRIDLWREVYQRIEVRDDWISLHEFSALPVEPHSREKRLILYMLFLFDDFSKMDIEPFNRRHSHLIVRAPTFDWEKLPVELHFLSIPAERFGGIQFPAEVTECLEHLTTETKDEFGLLVKQINANPGAVDRFLDEYRMTEHVEARLVYFLWSLLAQYEDSLNKQIDKSH